MKRRNLSHFSQLHVNKV